MTNGRGGECNGFFRHSALIRHSSLVIQDFLIPHGRRGVRWVRFLLVAGLAVLAQTTLMRALNERVAGADLLVAVLVAFSLTARRMEGFAVGLVLGLGRDLFTQEPFGLSTGVFAVLGYLVARLRLGGFADSVLLHMILGFVCSVASSFASVLASAAVGEALRMRSVVGHALVLAAATAVLCGLAAILLPVRWRRLSGRRTGFEDG